jgi:hypothetical protein
VRAYLLQNKIFKILLFIIFVTLTSCGSAIVEIKVDKPENKLYLSKELWSFLNELNTKPSIVLRVPNTELNATQVAYNDRFYDLVEREFIKNGYTVRDRGLLNILIKDKENIDYQKLADKIKTDLILEIQFGTKNDYIPVQKVKLLKNQKYKECDADKVFFAPKLYTTDIKITIVKKGLYAGTITIYSTACSDKPCYDVIKGEFNKDDLEFKNNPPTIKAGYGNPNIGIFLTIEEYAESLVNQIISILESR